MTIEFDSIDQHLLAVLHADCKLPLVKIGERVGLSTPSVNEQIRKLEGSSGIRGYTAVLDAHKLGKDATTFITAFINHPKHTCESEKEIDQFEDVQECHHVTGQRTLLLKLRTRGYFFLAD